VDLVQDAGGDELEHLWRGVELLLERLLALEHDARHQLGRLVGGEHDLLVGVVQRIEVVEELLLRRLLVREELDVADGQGVLRLRKLSPLPSRMKLMNSSVNSSEPTYRTWVPGERLRA
jgi:hypothetical protein